MTTLRPRIVWRTTAIWLALHAAIWLLTARYARSRYPWPADVRSLLEHWDAWHYGLIARVGYAGPVRWAFYPLYPLTVRALAWLTGLGAHPEIVGAIFSTLLFLAFCWLQTRLLAAPDPRLRALTPATTWGWLCFLCWPAAWAFHSFHTESLFLFLSLVALICARRERWLAAAVLAGLCALTRNQGVFLAVAVALDGALRPTGASLRRRAFVFCVSGLISATLFACWPAYQYLATGDPFMFVRAQGQFTPTINSASQFFGTLWFANAWQHVTWDYYFHHVLFVLLVLSVGLLLRRREWTLALYTALSLCGPLAQGHLENVFRYTTILFPALFVLGADVGRLPPVLRWTLFGCLLLLHLLYTRNYALGAWAY
jgi:Gpi18-like mannosyltransferase